MRNIIITGGELFNKGAQAMTFVAVDEMKKRFPDHKIYLLSEMDRQRPQEEKNNYCFDFTGWYPLKFARCQKNFLLRILCLIWNKKELLEAESLYKNTDLMIDISGYALGSNWSFDYCNTYLEHLEYAKAFNIPVYLMPQSFGPFDFKGEKGQWLDKKIQALLPGIKLICAREKEGFKTLVEKYRLPNVVKTDDLVLNNKGFELSNIYKAVPDLCLPEIRSGSVGIVPNKRNSDVANEKDLLEVYRGVIKKLLSYNKNIYLLSHSAQDQDLCRIIKAIYPDENRVILLEQEFNCVEFNEIVKEFDFLVASRFHSIVHAYKNAIPCISIGWATKYYDLLKLFEQERYMFDTRIPIEKEKIEFSIDYMIKKREYESSRIKEHLAVIQRDNVFDLISL